MKDTNVLLVVQTPAFAQTEAIRELAFQYKAEYEDSWGRRSSKQGRDFMVELPHNEAIRFADYLRGKGLTVRILK